MIVRINDKEVTLRMSFRAYMIYENITGKSFAPQTMTDVINFFFCILITSANDYDIMYNDFLDALDQNPDYMVQFSDWLNDEYKKEQKYSPEKKKKKKKVTEKK